MAEGQGGRSEAGGRGRAAPHPYAHLYQTTEWKALRARRLATEPLCRMCLPQLVEATVADHIHPHRGDLVLFFEFDNTQSLCKHHHDSTKQAQEKSRAHPIGNDGWPMPMPKA